LTKSFIGHTLSAMKALVITGGEGPPLDFLLRLAADSGLIIAADSGLHLAEEASIEPDYIIGDFDSIDSEDRLGKYDKRHIIKYPVLKDDTDTELALDLAKRSGANYTRIAGGGGGRLDHLLAVFRLFSRDDPPREWHISRDSAFLLEAGETMSFHALPGSRVSVFSLGEESSGMESQGLAWPLSGLVWGPGRFGVSNVATEGSFSLKAGSSRLLVILPIDFEGFGKDVPRIARILD
ncbi:MAG TPA: thiamine diphosphokinase, partial [Rectinemataceae bacterium]